MFDLKTEKQTFLFIKYKDFEADAFLILHMS